MKTQPTSIDLHLQTTNFLDERALAERWNISVKTLRNARVTGGLVPFVRIGRSVRYRLSDVVAYEAAHTHVSTSEGGNA